LRKVYIVDLSDEERAVADGDLAKLEALIARKRDPPAPPVPDGRYVFNPAADGRGGALPVVRRPPPSPRQLS
jgi:hypothetical protein